MTQTFDSKVFLHSWLLWLTVRYAQWECRSKSARKVMHCLEIHGLKLHGPGQCTSWIGSKKIWDEQIYVVKNLCCMFFDVLAFALLSNSIFWATQIFPFPQKCASQGLTVQARNSMVPFLNWFMLDLRSILIFG